MINLPESEPYVLSLGPKTIGYYATFAAALAAYRPFAYRNDAHLGNWVAADVDYDGLTSEEKRVREVVAELRAEADGIEKRSQNTYTRDMIMALTHAADLVAAKLGVK